MRILQFTLIVVYLLRRFAYSTVGVAPNVDILEQMEGICDEICSAIRELDYDPSLKNKLDDTICSVYNECRQITDSDKLREVYVYLLRLNRAIKTNVDRECCEIVLHKMLYLQSLFLSCSNYMPSASQLDTALKDLLGEIDNCYLQIVDDAVMVIGTRLNPQTRLEDLKMLKLLWKGYTRIIIRSLPLNESDANILFSELPLGLTELVLSHSPFHFEFNKLKKVPSLLELRSIVVEDCHLANNFFHLFDCIGSSLIELSIADNQLNPDQTFQLCQILAKFSMLKRLNISGNNFSTLVDGAIVKAILKLPHLEELNISDTFLGTVFFDNLPSSNMSNPSPKNSNTSSLNVSTSSIPRSSTSHLNVAFSSTTINTAASSQISIPNTSISSTSSLNAEISNAKNSKITFLNLINSGLTDEFLSKRCKRLCEMPCLTHLAISAADMSKTLKEIAKKIDRFPALTQITIDGLVDVDSLKELVKAIDSKDLNICIRLLQRHDIFFKANELQNRFPLNQMNIDVKYKEANPKNTNVKYKSTEIIKYVPGKTMNFNTVEEINCHFKQKASLSADPTSPPSLPNLRRLRCKIESSLHLKLLSSLIDRRQLEALDLELTGNISSNVLVILLKCQSELLVFSITAPSVFAPFIFGYFSEIIEKKSNLRLRKIVLKVPICPTVLITILKALQYLPALRSFSFQLQLNSSDIMGLFDAFQCKNIQTLRISCNDTGFSVFLKYFLPAFPNLTILKVVGPCSFPAFSSIPSQQPCIRSLTIDNYVPSLDDRLLYVLSSCFYLSKLVLNKSTDINYSFVNESITFGHLDHLQLFDISILNSSRTKLPYLKSLHITGGITVNEFNTYHWEDLPQLKCLHIEIQNKQKESLIFPNFWNLNLLTLLLDKPVVDLKKQLRCKNLVQLNGNWIAMSSKKDAIFPYLQSINGIDKRSVEKRHSVGSYRDSSMSINSNKR